MSRLRNRRWNSDGCYVHVGKRRYWFRLSDLGDRIILISKDKTRYEPTPGDIGHQELLRRIDTAMKADARFSGVAWFMDADYQAAGEGSVRITPSLSQRLRQAPRAGMAIGFLLFGVAFPIIEILTALGSFAGGRMVSAGLHALAGVAWVAFLFWGSTWISKRLYPRKS
jgi:hypothetical protein